MLQVRKSCCYFLKRCLLLIPSVKSTTLFLSHQIIYLSKNIRTIILLLYTIIYNFHCHFPIDFHHQMKRIQLLVVGFFYSNDFWLKPQQAVIKGAFRADYGDVKNAFLILRSSLMCVNLIVSLKLRVLMNSNTGASEGLRVDMMRDRNRKL